MRQVLLAGWVVLTVGCAKTASGSGELGQGSLLPSCATCTHITFPLAVGASQKVDPKATFGGASGVPLTLLSVDPAILGVERSSLRGIAPGVSAVLAITPEGKVLDFFHVTTLATDQLALAVIDEGGKVRGDLEDKLTALIADDILLRAVPMAGDQELAGQLDTTWTASSNGVTLIPGLVPSEYRLIARAPGSVQITISALGLERQLTVEVLP